MTTQRLRTGERNGPRGADGVTARSYSQESERLDAVRRYAILDIPADGTFDRVCALAARVFDVPFAAVTIVDEDRIWFAARKGLDALHVPRSPRLCASAILQSAPYVISDALADPRTSGNPLVHGQPGVRFYAAAPIVTRDGHRLGTVNVIDTKPRITTEHDTQTLQELAAIVMDELELRLAAIGEVQRAMAEQRRAENLARTLQRSLSPPRLPLIAGLDVARQVHDAHRTHCNAWNASATTSRSWRSSKQHRHRDQTEPERRRPTSSTRHLMHPEVTSQEHGTKTRDSAHGLRAPRWYARPIRFSTKGPLAVAG